MLEVVRVQIARFELKVRLNVIVKDDDFKGRCLFSARTGLAASRISACGVADAPTTSLVLALATPTAAVSARGKSERKQLFHGIVLLKIKGFDLLLILGMYSKPFGFESESGERRSQFRTRLSVLREIFMPTI